MEDARTPKAAFVDRETLEMLVTSHQVDVYRYVIYLGADPALAEDLVQETFLTTFRDAPPPSLADAGRRAAWLRGIARNLLRRHWERKASADVRPLEAAEPVWAAAFPRGGDGAAQLDALRACLEDAPERSRRLVDLRYRQGRSRREMADALAMSEDGVKSALRRIRTKLLECVQKRLKLEEAL